MADKKTRQFSFRTTDDLLEELESVSKQEDRTVAWLIDRALRDWLAWRRAKGSYDSATGEAADIVRLWPKLGPSQRKLIGDLLKTGALEMRDEDKPLLNENGEG